MMFREGESDKTWFRSDRCFAIDSQWFFATREGPQIGPFTSRQSAVEGVGRYIDSLQLAQKLAEQEHNTDELVGQMLSDVEDLLESNDFDECGQQIIKPNIPSWFANKKPA